MALLGPNTSLLTDSPAVKRQKTTSGYNSTSNSAENTLAYNSENDSGDDLLADFVPNTPGKWETQPTQIIDRSVVQAAPSPTPSSTVQVPASSPFTGRDSELPIPDQNPYPKPASPPKRNVAMSMAPAGTAYRPPHGIVPKPLQQFINLVDDDDDHGPQFQGGSSDDETTKRANIKPTTFISRSPQTSFSASSTHDLPKPIVGNASFQNALASASYKPADAYSGSVHDSKNRNSAATYSNSYTAKPKSSFDSMSSGYGSVRKPKIQTRPERAKPIEDISLDNMMDENVREKITKIRTVLPSCTVLMARNTIINCKGNWEDALNMLLEKETIVIEDDADEIESPQPVKQAEPQMKRMLTGPTISLRDKYSSTQAMPQAPKYQVPMATPPPKPKRKLVRGRRNPSSPAIPAISSPLKPQPQSSPAPSLPASYASDSGVASATEDDPELEGRVLKHLNKCSIDDLIELTNTTKEFAKAMIAARPFRNIDVARAVENPKQLKSGKKSARAPIGEKLVDTAIQMFSGYEAIDSLVAHCEQLGKPLRLEMETWGFDTNGAAKDGELEMISFEDDVESQRDSGIGSPSSGVASNNGDDDVKILSSTRKRSNFNYMKKPEMMAEDCVLKDYQVVGLNWLALMYRHEMSCILADEMGLGKTCQVIAFLSYLVENGEPGPHLVVCPGSTLENWLRELRRFSPNLVIEPYHGPQKERGEMADQILARGKDVNVVVTTYDMAAKREDNKFMRRLKPVVCVYDEGHMLKNVNSQRYQGLIRIPATFRLLLTGTPLQNNLQELAALLAFIMPQVFKELEEDLNYIFKTKTTTRDADHAALLSAQRIARAKSMLTPFVLRRKKTQVLKHLPAKTLRVEYAPIHPAQKEIYDGHLDQARERARIRVEGGKVPKTDENNPLMQLRKAAIHPLLFRRHFTDEKIEKMADILRKKDLDNFPSSNKRTHLIEEMRNGSDFWLHQWCLDYPCIRSFDIPDLAWMDSGKVASMIKLVKDYQENGDRVLIFSQFSLVLDILEAVLNSSLISFTRIDGSTKIEERQSLIDTYRDDESITAFLLTTKAGGTGINLMYANKVIIFDGSFNPQDDRQAENRAHRVGQTRPVEVVRLVTKNTIEEQIYALGQSKLMLDGRVAGEKEVAEDEAGEKAVAKMLLEGTVKPDDSEEEKKPSKNKELPQRKKSTLLGMATQSQREEKGYTQIELKTETKAKLKSDGDEMLVE